VGVVTILYRFAVPFVAMLLAFAPAAGRAESKGAYTHDVLREADEKLIVCYDIASAMETAEAVNAVMLDLHDDLAAAPDEFARQTLFQERLYPSDGWGVLLTAIRELRCDLIDVASHISRRTVLMGPESLRAAGLSHHVVQSDMITGTGDASVPVWIVTTQGVPAG
jgi:hypothetical protein